MKIDEIRVLLIELVDRLNAADSWSGETHIQKSMYFLQELCKKDTGFSFILHKFGPYSFDLKSELLNLESVGILEREDTPPYGSHFSTGSLAKKYKSIVSPNIDEYISSIDWIIANFGNKVTDLEKEATALYALNNFEGSDDDMATKIHEIKPHISKAEALSAIQSISDKITEFSA